MPVRIDADLKIKNYRDNYYNFLGIQDFSIPREVIEMLDVAPADKLVYAIIYTMSKRTGMCSLKPSHIAALTGLTPGGAKQKVHSLSKRGLIIVQQRNKYIEQNGKFRRLPSIYKPVVPKRRTGRNFPAPLRSRTEYLVKEFKEYFHEIKL